MTRTASQEEAKRQEEAPLNACAVTRQATLQTILVDQYACPVALATALAAGIGEAVAHIAHNLTNYIEHEYAGTTNPSGDEQLQLDLDCDQAVFDACRRSQQFAVVASEETPVETVLNKKSGSFSMGCDPLDGSSIIDANFSVGSVFGIWPGTSLVGRTGREQVAAAVALYGPRTVLCIALPATTTAAAAVNRNDDDDLPSQSQQQEQPSKDRVLEVTLVHNRSAWELSRDAIHLEPDQIGKIFAPGNLRATNDHPRYARLVQYFMTERYQLRYSGGMVYHMFAKSKGIFTNVSSPSAKAKLRLLYEVAPLGLIVECAGGVAICDDQDVSVLDVVIDHTDHRMGVCFGGKADVAKYKEIMFDG